MGVTGRNTQPGRRLWAWSAATLAAVFLSGAVLARALGADEDPPDPWTGWSTIAGLLAATLLVLAAVAMSRPATRRSLPQCADMLTDEVLLHEGAQLTALISAEPGRPRPIDLPLRTADGRAGRLSTVADLWRAQSRGRLIVAGEPGAGKTVLLHTLVCDVAEARRRLADDVRAHTPTAVLFDVAVGSRPAARRLAGRRAVPPVRPWAATRRTRWCRDG